MCEGESVPRWRVGRTVLSPSSQDLGTCPHSVTPRPERVRVAVTARRGARSWLPAQMLCDIGTSVHGPDLHVVETPCAWESQ